MLTGLPPGAGTLLRASVAVEEWAGLLWRILINILNS
jgi:hypothetical protein